MIRTSKQAKEHLKKKSTRKKIQLKVGQTMQTKDKYLPNAKKELGEKTRPVIVLEVNEKGECVITPGSKQKTPNTKYYGKYGIKYYRSNIEVVDNENKPIKQNEKFVVNEKCSKLPELEASKILDNVVNHTKFASENRKKLNQFKARYKKR